MEKGMEEKVKEWFTFLTIAINRVYLLNGIQVEFLTLPYLSLSLEWTLFSDLNAEVSQEVCILLLFAYTCISF